MQELHKAHKGTPIDPLTPNLIRLRLLLRRLTPAERRRLAVDAAVRIDSSGLSASGYDNAILFGAMALWEFEGSRWRETTSIDFTKQKIEEAAAKVVE